MGQVSVIVPCRAGSKRLPGKNFRELSGRPLWRWVVDAWAESRVGGTLYVSTDAPSLLGDDVPAGVRVHRRAAEDAGDLQSTEALLGLWVRQCAIPCREGDVLIVLQPTSPLMRPDDIALVVECLQTVTSAATAATSDAGWFASLTGGIYAVRADVFAATGRLVTGDAGVVDVDFPASIDIDTEADWSLAEWAARGCEWGEVMA